MYIIVVTYVYKNVLRSPEIVSDLKEVNRM
jgi:hypothetical protein